MVDAKLLSGSTTCGEMMAFVSFNVLQAHLPLLSRLDNLRIYI